jgi:hypothetical protein
MKSLSAILSAVGKSPAAYQTPDGTRLLILPHGGRVIGLFGPKSASNFYWTNPALGRVGSARTFFVQDAWHNSGGERTWLAPEVDLFFPEFPKLDRYEPPRALDPGRYRLKASAGTLSLESRFKVSLSRLDRQVSLCITKTFGPAPNPLRHERDLDVSDVEFAGYTRQTSLEWSDPGEASMATVGLWNLIQFPHGGELLVPTFSRSVPQHVFGTVGRIEPADLKISGRLVRYRMCQAGEHKISFRAASVCGRAGYVFRAGSEWSLVVCNFSVNPSGEYVDVPWRDPSWSGFGVQACNVNSRLGQFAELEYHVPAIGRGTGRMRCEDFGQVWAFRGSKSQVLKIARELLAGPDLVF